MRNNAQQTQELELWQVTGISKGGNMRIVRQNSVIQRGDNAALRSGTSQRNATERGVLSQKTISVNLPQQNMQGQRRASGTASSRSAQGQRRASGTVSSRSAQGQRRASGTVSSRSVQGQRRISGTVSGQNIQEQGELSVNLPRRNMQGQRHVSGTASRQNVQNPRRVSERSTQGQRGVSAYPMERGVPRQRSVLQNPSARGVQKQQRSADRQERVSKKQHARRRRVRFYRHLAALFMLVLFVGIFLNGKSLYEKLHIPASHQKEDEGLKPTLDTFSTAEEEWLDLPIQKDFLSISEYNRPGTELSAVNNIFVHYTANPKTSAAQNRSYFEGLGQTHERAASAHFIIGYDGEIIQCIPLEEEAYAVIGRNSDSISIECCYISEDGAFTQETYDSLICLLALLTEHYDLEAQDILRHYDCGGKRCPLYYVEHEDAWQRLLQDVEQYQPELARTSSK